MPIEIRELHIRVAVEAKPGSKGGRGRSAEGADGGPDKDAIVAECVDQVLHILQSKGER